MSISRRRLLGGAAAAAIVTPPRGVHGQGGEPREVSRRVLALYKSEEPYGDGLADATLNAVHLLAQMPLNWLGLMVDYHDVSRGLPAEGVMGRYLGVISWFESLEMREPMAYLSWLGAQMRAGRRVVILGTLGALRAPGGEWLNPARMAEALGPSGLEFGGDFTQDPRLIEVRHKDPRLIEFERKLPPGLPNYYRVASRRPDNRSHLVLGRRDRRDSASHLVVTGPWGGFAGDDYVAATSAVSYATPEDKVPTADPTRIRHLQQWIINPFEFFRTALGIGEWPRPDVTTFNGRRVFYSHIDGDGMRNISEVRPRALSGEIILEDILARYRLPITVSVVVAEVVPGLLGSPQTQALARAMFARPNVEAGSHSYFHPLDWERQTRSFELPGHPFSLEQETVGSVSYIDTHLLPPGKRVRIFQWSGSTRVSPQAIALLDRIGIPNINGGDPMKDRQWPSYTRVAPLMRQVGQGWQNYTSASNENLYTNLWTGPFYGFRYARETFRNTETPRRVSPINVYYHFYSGERIASLKALREVYDDALRQPIAPLFTSEYVAMVAGFRSARIARVEGGWQVWDHGALRTVRFDAADGFVDLTRSRGILGARRHGDALYVHLAGSEPATIILGRSQAAAPFIVWASHRVSAWIREGRTVRFTLSGIGEKEVEIGGLPPGRDVTASLTADATTRTETLRADGNGNIVVAAGSAAQVEVRLT
jgi:hypothetical protein